MGMFDSLAKYTGLSTKPKEIPRAPTVHIRVRGTLYVKPADSAAYQRLTEIGCASFNIVSNVGAHRQHRLQVFEEGEDDPALEQDVENMTLTFHHETGAVMWSTLIDNEIQELAFRAQVDDDARNAGIRVAGELSRAIVDTYNRCLYGQLVGDQSYIDKAPPLSSQASSSAQAEDDENDFSYVTAAGTQAATNIREEDDASQPDEDIAVFKMDPGTVCSTGGAKSGRNVCFADSIKHTRTITCSDEGKGKVRVTATPFGTTGHNHADQQDFLLDDMENLSIGKNCLTNNDEKRMYLHNTFGATGVTELDLEAGKVVQEFAPSKGYTINAISYAAKSADNEPNLITCLSNNVAFSIDKRLDSRNCVVAEAGKSTGDYALAATTPKFLCHATSNSGFLAVGSLSGDIRLYSGVPGSQRTKGYSPKTAKTLLRGNPKHPITHIDITQDGKYIVAVTPEYLLVLPTEYVDKNGKATSGFAGRMGKDKPIPLSLSLSAAQKRSMKGVMNPEFTTAKFDIGDKQDGKEEWIVAACGSYLVTWSMENIKKAYKDNIRATEAGEITSENNVVNGVNMLPIQGTEFITFITDHEVGMAARSKAPENQTRKRGFTYFAK